MMDLSNVVTLWGFILYPYIVLMRSAMIEEGLPHG
jgi:hypothetical protein